ncbi:Bromodomain-containing protein, partial [Caulochytrium protostelioides]
PRVRYLEAKNIIMSQRRSVFQDISGRLNPPTVFPGLAAFKDPNCKSVDPAAIPGLAEAGWVLTMGESPMSELPKPRNPHYMFFRKMLQEMRENKDVWPFVEPVSGVADYYDIIKEPMSVRNLEENVEADLYPTIDAFVAAAQLIFDNCRTYNEDGTPYVKCANRLEK